VLFSVRENSLIGSSGTYKYAEFIAKLNNSTVIVPNLPNLISARANLNSVGANCSAENTSHETNTGLKHTWRGAIFKIFDVKVKLIVKNMMRK
jgi:hypothetical protein